MWQLQEPEEKNVTFYVKKNKKQFWLILVHMLDIYICHLYLHRRKTGRQLNQQLRSSGIQGGISFPHVAHL